MRILQLITQNQLRGAEVFSAQLSEQLASRGHEVVLAYLLGDSGPLTTRPEVRQVGLGGTVASRMPFSLVVWRNLSRVIGEFDPDIIQANGSETFKYAALLRLVDRSRPIVYRNISVMSMWAGSGLKRRIVGAALRRMSHVASVSKVGERDLIEGFGLRPEQVSVLPIGVVVPRDVSQQEREAARASVRREVGVAAEAPLVIHVGSLSPEKNHKELIEAFARVVAEVPGALLLLVGDGPLRRHVEAAVADAGLSGRVILTGAIPDAFRVIASADVLALPSLREGMPGVILEAGVAGIPVVAYDVGGVGEVVESGVTGFIVKCRDVEGLASALIRVLTEPMTRKRLGDEARRMVAREFGLTPVAGSFEALYAGVLANSETARPRIGKGK